MVQMTCRIADVAGNLATMERFCEQAAAAQIDIICFPEFFNHPWHLNDC